MSYILKEFISIASEQIIGKYKNDTAD